MVGTFENFNDAGWNGDVPGFIPSAAAPVWPWPDVGNYQTTNRIAYLSPTWSGFRFGVSFAPNNNALINAENCAVAGPGCNRTISTPFATTGSVFDSPRYNDNDIVDAAGEYTGTFGPVGVNAGVGYLHSTPVANSLPGTLAYNGLSLGHAGLTLSYAGFTAAGNILGGEYAIGPVIVGASYDKSKSRGDFQSLATEGVGTDQGIAAGGAFAVAPGLALYLSLSYLYGTRRQVGYDFATDAPGTAFNNVRSQAFSVGTVLKW